MTLVDRSHAIASAVVRPLTGLRGAGRVCRALNRVHLALGATPVKPARMRDGARILVDVRSRTEQFAWYSGCYDDVPVRLCGTLIDLLGGNFLDVGGNIGMYAVRVARQMPPDARIFVVEPVPANQARILENARINRVEQQIHLIPSALSNHAGEATIVLREDFELGASTGNASVAISASADGDFARIVVPMARFDDVRRQEGLERIHLAKVDIEGHEDLFFEGAGAWISEEHPLILTEVNNWYYKKRGTTIGQAFRRTLPLEYQAFLFHERGKTIAFEAAGDLDELSGMQNVLLATPTRLESICSRTNRLTMV